MSESLRKKLVFLTLPLAILYALYSMQSKKPAVPATSEPSLATIQPIAVANVGGAVEVASTIDRQKLLAAPWGRDPFRFGSRPISPQQHRVLPATKGPSEGRPVEWKVSGIVYSETNPIAYVNRKAVTVGDIVDDARVVAITKTSVTLEYAGRRITVAPR